jgi:small-conductance mechanosensitive channel
MANGDLTVQILEPVEELTRDVILFLPNLIAAIIILIVGWILGRFLGRVVSEILDRIGVDDALRKTSVGRYIERSTTSIVRLFDLIVRWFIYLIAILAAVSVLQIAALSVFVAAIVAYIPNILAFLLILIIGFIVVDWGVDFIRHFGETHQIEYMGMVTMLLRVFFYFVIVILALEQLLLDLTIIYVFLVPVAWGIGIGLGAVIAIVAWFGMRNRAPEIVDSAMGKAKQE